jgi:hypothetical protein
MKQDRDDQDAEARHEFLGAFFGHHPSCEKHPDNVARATGAGSAQVATPAYRSNYETIFGKRVEAGQA